MTQPHPTPTSHGAWRVIDGKLVNEDDTPAAPAKPVAADETTAAPESVPDTTHRKISTRK